MTSRLVWITVAGGLGALCRYGLSGVVQRHAGAGFPWGTLAVNLSGCLLAGLLWALAESRLGMSPTMRTVVFVGFMGAFTTFSTFMLETGNLLQDGAWLAATGNLLLHNGGGFLALVAGFALGRLAG